MNRAMLVHDLLRIGAQKTPSKVALIVQGNQWTYGELETHTNKLANAIREFGFERGDRAAVALPNSAEAVIAFFAILKAGGTACILHAGIKSAKLAFILRDSGATLLLTNRAGLESLITSDDSPLRQIILTDDIPEQISSVMGWKAIMADADDTNPSPLVIDQDLAFLIYTSGSTGEAKGVMCPHASVLAAVHAITTYLKHTSHDVIVNVLPLAFDHGLYQVLTMFYIGGTLLLEQDFTFPYATLHRMKEAGVTGFPGVPTVFSLLLRLRAQTLLPPSLRYIASTGAALAPFQIRQIQDRLQGVTIYSMYGLTECKRVSYLPPDELDRRPTSIGRGMPNEEIWVVNPDGERLGPRQVGELVIRGSNVMRGYWNRPEETARVFRRTESGELVLHSGDLMWMDEEGFFYFVGRRDDLIKSRGEKIYPREIEDALYAIPGIIEAAVVGKADDVLGQAVIAHIVADPAAQLSKQQILEALAQHLDAHALPKELHFNDSLPKNASGKIDKHALQV